MPTSYGLNAPRAIHWLLDEEKDVHAAICRFIAGQTDLNYVDVAGPPTNADLLHYHEKKAQTVPLPCVRLNLKMFTNNTTGEEGVEVTCSDIHLEEISRWYRMKALKPQQQRLN